jgi:hypothetical protein
MPITDSLRVAIEALHQAIRDEPQAEDKAALTQCLTQMMRVQAKNLAEGDYGPAGAGAGGGGAGGNRGRVPALVAQLSGGIAGGGQ